MPCKDFKLRWNDKPLHEVIFGREEESLSSTSINYMESLTAAELGIPYDETWFSIPIKSRNYMVATRLGREWLSSLHEEESVKKSRQGRML